MASLEEFENGHELCRGKVCVVCFKKGTRLVSESEATIIKKYIIEGYSISNPDLPRGICVNCHLSLSKKNKDPNFEIPNQAEDYNPRRKTSLRSITSCDCLICNVSRQRGFFLHHERKERKKRGRPPTNETPASYKICGNCFTKLYRGCSHSSEVCKNSRRSKVDGIMEVASPTSLNRAASRVGPSTPLGRPKKVSDVRKELFTTEDLYGIGQDLRLTGTGYKTFISDIRRVTGSRTSVEKGAMETIRQKNHRLDEFFALNSYVYRVKNKETKVDENVERYTVICNDVQGFVDTILEKRDREWGDNILLRIGMDGGGGFFKVLLSIFDKDDPFPNVKSSLSKKIKESGVRKVFVMALVPNISENYVNVKKLWLNLQLQKIRKKYTIATDLKLINIILGLMSHSSCHPCPWCDVHKDQLHKKGKRRTLSSLMNLFWDFFDARCSTDDAKKHGNVIHPPMINDEQDDDTPVIQILPPPELHLMTGPTNTMFKGLELVWPENETWLKSINVKKTEYHGGQFTGNDCRKLLNNVDKMEDLSDVAKRYCDAFTAFNDVVIACYGDQLKEDYVSKIKIFASAYNALPINITPKVHAVVYHIKEFCTLTGRGLVPWSEQTGEALHHDFNKTWDKFKVREMDNPVYGEHLLRAVREHNGQHI